MQNSIQYPSNQPKIHPKTSRNLLDTVGKWTADEPGRYDGDIQLGTQDAHVHPRYGGEDRRQSPGRSAGSKNPSKTSQNLTTRSKIHPQSSKIDPKTSRNPSKMHRNPSKTPPKSIKNIHQTKSVLNHLKSIQKVSKHTFKIHQNLF